MTRRQHYTGWALAAVGALLAVGLISCTDGLLMTPARGVPVQLTFAVTPAATVAGVDADACTKATIAHIQLLQSDAVALDTSLTVSRPCDQAITLAVPSTVQLGALQLVVALLANNQAVFQGSASVQLSRGQRTDATVTVAPVAAGIIAPDSLRTFTKLADSTRLSSAVVFATGDTLQGVVPVWTDDGKGIVSVANGFVRSRAEGSAVLTASFQGLTRTTHVSVRAVVASVAVAGVADTALIYLAGTRTFVAVPRDSNGNALQRTIVWASANPQVATVSAQGAVRGVALGRTTITASADAKADTFSLSVVPAPVARVTVTPNPDTIYTTQTTQVTATTYDAAGNVLTGRTVTWSTSNARIAAVNSTGLVTGFSGGTATITATSEGISGGATIIVLQPILQVTPAAVIDSANVGLVAATTLLVTNAGTGVMDGLAARVTYPPPPPTGGQYPQFVTSVTLSPTSAPASLTVQFSNQFTCGIYNATLTVSSSTVGVTAVDVPVTFKIQNCIFLAPAPIQSVRPTTRATGGPLLESADVRSY